MGICFVALFGGLYRARPFPPYLSYTHTFPAAFIHFLTPSSSGIHSHASCLTYAVNMGQSRHVFTLKHSRPPSMLPPTQRFKPSRNPTTKRDQAIHNPILALSPTHSMHQKTNPYTRKSNRSHWVELLAGLHTHRQTHTQSHRNTMHIHDLIFWTACSSVAYTA